MMVPSRKRLQRILYVLSLFLSIANAEDSYYAAGDDDYVPQSLPVFVCDDSVVVVTFLTVECNSPYTFYYGNGANRQSSVCDYGDKATVTGTVRYVCVCV